MRKNRRAGLLRMIEEHPDESNRKLAFLAGVSAVTVGRYRRLLELSGKIDPVAYRRGRNNMLYPSAVGGSDCGL